MMSKIATTTAMINNNRISIFVPDALASDLSTPVCDIWRWGVIPLDGCPCTPRTGVAEAFGVPIGILLGGMGDTEALLC